MTSNPSSVEGVGENYTLEAMLETRARTRAVINEIAAAVHVGMAEESAVEMAREKLKAAELLRGWHGLHIRFGANTLKNFGEPSEPGVVLAENDIFFIDIGPVWRKWEGDGGDTFVVGGDPDMLAVKNGVRQVFDQTHDKWRREGASGRALYAFATQCADDLGFELNLHMNGHRLGDFPHSAFHKGPLEHFDQKPNAALWVLEVQIRHKTRQFGAFYEDMLLEA